MIIKINLRKLFALWSQRDNKTYEAARHNKRLELRGGARTGSRGGNRSPDQTPTTVTRSSANSALHTRVDAEHDLKRMSSDSPQN